MSQPRATLPDMAAPLDPRMRAALEALDERIAAEQINLRIYVSGGIVAAFVFDPDETQVDFAAAADRGDEVLATIGADIARQHGLPADWIHRIDAGPDTTRTTKKRRHDKRTQKRHPRTADPRRSRIRRRRSA